MYDIFSILLGLGLTIGLLLLGLHIAIAIGFGGILLLVLVEGFGSLNAIGFILWGSLNSATLSALPLFILMAEIMLKSGVSDSFYDGMSKLVRRIPGGLLQTNIAASALFAAISGSSVATASAIGGVALPRQKADGYDSAMAAGSVAAGGTLGILIPPSIVMIVYSTFTELSVAKLFMAGLLPGIVVTAMFMAYIAIRCAINPTLAPKLQAAKRGDTVRGLREVAPMVGLMLVVLVTIYRGIATPTEAAAIGAFVAAIIAWAIRRPPLRVYVEAIFNSVVTSAAILMIVAAAFIIQYAVESTGLANALTDWVVGLGLSFTFFMLTLFVIFAIMGCFIDAIGLVVLTVPLLLPILQSYGIDLIWFGVITVIVVELSLITPPVGINLFVVDSISKAGLATVIRGVIPYFGIYALLLTMLMIWPSIATWLPSLM